MKGDKYVPLTADQIKRAEELRDEHGYGLGSWKADKEFFGEKHAGSTASHFGKRGGQITAATKSRKKTPIKKQRRYSDISFTQGQIEADIERCQR